MNAAMPKNLRADFMKALTTIPSFPTFELPKAGEVSPIGTPELMKFMKAMDQFYTGLAGFVGNPFKVHQA